MKRYGHLFFIGAVGFGALAWAFGVMAVMTWALSLCSLGVIAYFGIENAKLNLEERRAFSDVQGFRAVPSKHGVLSFYQGDLQFWTPPAREPVTRIGAGVISENTEGETEYHAVDMVKDALFLVIIGPQGTGKSTFLKHLISERATDNTVIIDPHGLPSDYCGFVPMGMGRNYAEINQTLQDMIDLLTARYNSGHFNHERVNIYIDELTLLHKHCKIFPAFMQVMLTESRKVNIRLTVCVHSRRAQFLGLKGGYDLVEGITFLTLKNDRGNRYGELETDEGIIRVTLPGPFLGNGFAHSQPSQSWQSYPSHGQKSTVQGNCDGYDGYDNCDDYDETADVNPVILSLPSASGVYFDGNFYDSRTDKDICDLYRAGSSLNAIAKAVYGHTNKQMTARVKGVLANYGVMKS
jgi:hypothetical protein